MDKVIRKKDSAKTANDMGTTIMTADKSGVTVLAPGTSMTPTVSGMKRKMSNGSKMETLPMLDRLRMLSKENDAITTPPRTDSLLQLLLQGLHNRDQKILDSVLDRADEDLIDQTVRKLPVEGVVPLIEELQHYIRGRGMVNQSHAKWLRSVLQHHTAFLMSNPHCEEMMSPVLAMLEARTKHYSPLLQLKGKLDIMTRQIKSSSTSNTITAAQTVQREALLVHQDDSSDELSEVLDELLLPPSDTEENWNLDDDDSDEDDSEEDEAESDMECDSNAD